MPVTCRKTLRSNSSSTTARKSASTRWATTLYALENVCPHAYALLTQGFVDGDTVECPLHEAVFHIPTGKCLKEPGGRDLKTYSVRLAGEEIQIKVE